MAEIRENDFSAFSQKQRKQLLDAINNQMPTITETYTNKTITSAVVNTLVDASGYIYQGSAASIPTAGTAGYAVGCIITLTTCVLGQYANWINTGTAASCVFVPHGLCNGYCFAFANGPFASAGGDATEVITHHHILANDIAFVQVVKCDDNDQVCGAVCTDQTLTLTLTADPVAATKDYNWTVIRDNEGGEYDIFAAGTYDCLTADDTTVAITVAGVLATDFCFMNYTVSDDNDLISDIILTANTITVTVQNDPGTDGTHSWSYCVIRKRGSFTPSHYIAYAGQYDCLTADDDTVAITVTGALATDIPIVCFETTDDTDTFEFVTVAADLLTLTVDADPDTDGTHSWHYMLLRAY